MTIRELVQNENITALLEVEDDALVSGGYTSDLLSDVMAHAREGDLLITIQAHPNAVAVASLAGVCAILVCGNRPVAEDMLEAARREQIAVLSTPLNQFQASCLTGRLLGLDHAG